MKKLLSALLVVAMTAALVVCSAQQQIYGAAPVTCESFQAMSPEQKKEVFLSLSGPEIYDLVKESDENWPVTAYDLVSPENAKEMIILYEDNGDPHFNLAWPCYGGFSPESIASIGDLSGTLDVSRDGGDGGYSMSYGLNADGSYPNDAQRSVPKSSATVRTGTMDIDQYKTVVEAVTQEKSEDERLADLKDLGYSEEIASRFIEDQAAWLTRDEVAGSDNIADGAASVGHKVDARYGYYGVTAPWQVAGLDLCGGAGQLNTVFSWGTLCDSGIIYDIGTADIK